MSIEYIFIQEWDKILKNEPVFFSFIQYNDCLEKSVNSALKGIQYYYYGKPYYALKCINFSLSKLGSSYSIIKSILLYYRISIQCDENNLRISQCWPIYNCFCNINPYDFKNGDTYKLIMTLFYKGINQNDIPAWIEHQIEYLNEIKDSFTNKTLYNFVKLRMLNLMADQKDNDDKCWEIYINEIESSKFIVDLPYAKLHYIKTRLRKIGAYSLKNEIEELEKLTVKTRNSQVELKICKEFTNRTCKINQIKEINEIESQIYEKGILFNTLNDCFDILWGVDSIELYCIFLKFIKELDNNILYLFNGNLIPEYVDHGIGHVVSMLTNLKRMQLTIIQGGRDFYDFFGIDKSDYVTLIIAIIYHDIGMSGTDNIKAASGGVNVRNSHSLFSWEIIKHILYNEFDQWHCNNHNVNVNEIALIASLHTADFDSTCNNFNFNSQKNIIFPDGYQEDYKSFFNLITEAQLVNVNKLIAMLQLMDGIDFNNKRNGIAKKDSIIPKRLELYEKLSKKCPDAEIKKYFDDQVSCIGNWYKHYRLHKYTKNLNFIFTDNNTLMIQILLDNDYYDEAFIRNGTHVKTFTSLTNFFQTEQIQIKIVIYNDNFNITY